MNDCWVDGRMATQQWARAHKNRPREARGGQVVEAECWVDDAAVNPTYAGGLVRVGKLRPFAHADY